MLEGKPWEHDHTCIERPCGCVYAKDGTPVIRCDADKHITCARCGRTDAQITPLGMLCLTCTFGQPKVT